MCVLEDEDLPLFLKNWIYSKGMERAEYNKKLDPPLGLDPLFGLEGSSLDPLPT